jgi:hypothetical protein
MQREQIRTDSYFMMDTQSAYSFPCAVIASLRPLLRSVISAIPCSRAKYQIAGTFRLRQLHVVVNQTIFKPLWVFQLLRTIS